MMMADFMVSTVKYCAIHSDTIPIARQMIIACPAPRVNAYFDGPEMLMKSVTRMCHTVTIILIAGASSDILCVLMGPAVHCHIHIGMVVARAMW